MQHIRSNNTKIEEILRKALWNKGYRYRKNFKDLPGKPDIVITKYKGLDPEVGGGVDKNIYPRPVTFSLGLVAQF